MDANPVILVVRSWDKVFLRSIDHSQIAKESKQWMDAEPGTQYSTSNQEELQKCGTILSGLVKSVAKMVTGCLESNKSCYICSMKLKRTFS